MCHETLVLAEAVVALLFCFTKYRGLTSYLLDTTPGDADLAFNMAHRPLLSMITSVTDLNHGYPTPAHSPTEAGEVTCWLLDTRELWPGDSILTARGGSEALSLISVPEQNVVKGKMFVQDARMSLASALLKRLFISKTLGIGWHEVRMARKGNEKHGKPCAVDNVGRPIAGIDFNVSHQGGLVALVGYNGRANHEFTPSGMVYGMISPSSQSDEVMCGVDIVCVNERDDYRTIDAEGFDGWVDIYEYVFSGEERWSMKYDVDYITLYDGSTLSRDEIGRHDRCISRDKPIHLTTPTGQEYSFSSELILESKLRRFYTYFCYKESYIKLAGEALLAPWLKQLEFFNVRSPKPGTEARCSTHGTWGEEVDDVEVHMHGRPVSDVRMKIQAFEENYMISTAIQGDIQGLKVPAFRSLDLQTDVLAFAPLSIPKAIQKIASPHKRNFSEPIKTTPTRRPTIIDPLINTLYTLKDMPNMNDHPYLYSREVPMLHM